jgi:hypothetical protein
MEHEKAVETKASERYLLDEMTEAERLEFEEHYFECEACAEDVRSGEILVCSIEAIGAELPSEAPKVSKAASSKWREWFFPRAWAPSGLAAAMTLAAAYQAFIVIPPLREIARPQAVRAVVLRPVARGEEPVIQLNRSASVSVLMLDVNNRDPGKPIQWKLVPPAGQPLSGDAEVPAAGDQLQIWIPNASLHPTGAWSLILKDSHGDEVGRYPFQLQPAR